MSEPRPKIIHRTTGKSLSRLRAAASAFNKRLMEVAETMIGTGELDSPSSKIIAESDQDLLMMRKKLALVIRDGMYGRHDKEIEIAILAMLVWANRKQEEGEKIFDIF